MKVSVIPEDKVTQVDQGKTKQAQNVHADGTHSYSNTAAQMTYHL